MKKKYFFIVVFLSFVIAAEATTIGWPSPPREVFCKCVGTHITYSFEVKHRLPVNIKVIDSSADLECDRIHINYILRTITTDYPPGTTGTARIGYRRKDNAINYEQCMEAQEAMYIVDRKIEEITENNDLNSKRREDTVTSDEMIDSAADAFRDCPDCPEMVVIPAGSFMMGAPRSEDKSDHSERPVHEVSIAYSFAIGKYEVTFDEWNVCVSMGGCTTYHTDSAMCISLMECTAFNSYSVEWGQGYRPVVSISWQDAQEYVQWLSSRTGYEYRLPSEAEWEYAVRAGTTTPFNTGDSITHEHANFKTYYGYGNYPGIGLYWRQTLEVGSFPANGFVLYDMHGNVWEWIQDCWHENYDGAPNDGSVWETGECEMRVLRGGAWDDEPGSLRSAYRYRALPQIRVNSIGFRVVRGLTH